MRPQVLLIIGVAVALMAALLWTAHKPVPRARPAGDGVAAAVTETNPEAGRPGQPGAATVLPGSVPPPAPPVLPPAPASPPPEVVQAEEAQIQQLLSARSPESLPGLTAKLDSPIPEVRGNAVEALKQLGDTQAIPVLRQKAENTQDPEEKARLLAAADFLALPPWHP